MQWKIVLTVVFSLGLNSIAQEIEFQSLKNYTSNHHKKLTKSDSIAGNNSFSCSFYLDEWHFVKSFKELGKKSPYTKHNYKRDTRQDSIHRIRYSDQFYMLDVLKGVKDSQEVICMGYYGPPDYKKQEQEYFAIRLTDEMKLDKDLSVHFNYLSPCGVFQMYTNSKPSLKGAFMIEELIVEHNNNGVQTYKEVFDCSKKQIGHVWFIVRIDFLKEFKMNLGSSITFFNPYLQFNAPKNPDSSVVEFMMSFL